MRQRLDDNLLQISSTRTMTDHRIEQLTAWYQPIVDLNTGKVAGCEVLSRIVAADGSAGSAAALMDELEREPEAQYALIRKLLECDPPRDRSRLCEAPRLLRERQHSALGVRHRPHRADAVRP